jgi:serine/threonine-protein kinase HipA
MTREIGEKADALLEELGETGIYHPILKTVRRIIETRAKLVLSTIAKA